MTSKTCSLCSTSKPHTEFHPNRARPDGVATYCRVCASVYSSANYLERRVKDPVGVWAYNACRSAKKRALRAGVPYALTVAMLIGMAPTHCPVVGIPLDYAGAGAGKNGTTKGSPTVDRFSPALGYVPGNVTVISMRANRIKQDVTYDVVYAVADWMRANTPK